MVAEIIMPGQYSSERVKLSTSCKAKAKALKKDSTKEKT